MVAFFQAASTTVDKAEQNARTQQSEAPASNSGCFHGVHITFWTRSHTATLKQKARQAGATLEDKISEHTKVVVAARDTSAVDAASGLADLPTSIPRQSKKWEGRKLRIPTNIDFVVPQYISDCLVQGRLLPTSAYLIALQQVATNDSRTYSNEECAVSTSGGAEVSQAPKAMSTDQQPSAIQPSAIQSSAIQPSTQAQGTAKADSSPADLKALPKTAQGTAKAASPSGALDDLQKAAGPTALTSLQLATGMQDITNQSAEKKLGIYPDVSPEGRSFTGAHTGIPWGTGQ